MTRRAIERLFGINPAEVVPALLCALCYFLVLSAWFILRPLRDQAGLAGGPGNLNWLFLVTLGLTLAMTPLYGGLAHALSRRRFIAVVYMGSVVSLALFGVAFASASGAAEIWIGRGFYIWASVLNMFLVAVFTALMVDVWSPEASRRAFGLIAVGGTLGAISGSAITAFFASRVSTSGLIGASCAVFIAAACLMIFVAHSFASVAPREEHAPRTPLSLAAASEGVWLVLKSPYLLGVCAFMLCLTILSSFLYFEKMRILRAAIEAPGQQRAVLAQINLGTQTLTLLAQVFLTAHALRRLGVALTLLVLPLVTLGGFFALALSPILATVITFEVVRGASNYAFAKPARETLFTVVTRAEKYKAKGFIDTFVYRGGDALGALSDKAVTTWISPGAVPWVAMGVAGVWGFVALGLGLRQRSLASTREPLQPIAPAPVECSTEPVIAASPAGGRP